MFLRCVIQTLQNAKVCLQLRNSFHKDFIEDWFFFFRLSKQITVPAACMKYKAYEQECIEILLSGRES